MELKSDDTVPDLINSYPESIRNRVKDIRDLIIKTADELESVDKLTETLKWGEPSYLTSNGSTVRIAWKKSDPDHFGIFFHCQTELIRTFRKLFPAQFTFEGNRAILFHKDDEIPKPELQKCVSLALEYHKVKHLPLLGV